MLTFTDDDFKAKIQAETGPEAGMGPAEAFGDLEEDVRQSIKAPIVTDPFIPYTDQVRGFVYEVATGRLREVAA